ncbi:hypothetical protein Tco_0150197 [Tanacetum coccineum]
MSTSRVPKKMKKTKSPFISSSSSSSESDNDYRKRKNKYPLKSLEMDAYVETNLNDANIQNLCEEIKEDHRLSISLLEQYSIVQKRMKRKMKQLQDKLG